MKAGEHFKKMWFASNLSQSLEEILQQNWNKKEKGRHGSQETVRPTEENNDGNFQGDICSESRKTQSELEQENGQDQQRSLKGLKRVTEICNN